MGEDITKTGNLFPARARIPLLEIVREFFHRFPDNLEIPDNGIPAPAVPGKFLK
jgi:hypothetical protein